MQCSNIVDFRLMREHAFEEMCQILNLPPTPAPFLSHEQATHARTHLLPAYARPSSTPSRSTHPTTFRPLSSLPASSYQAKASPSPSTS